MHVQTFKTILPADQLKSVVKIPDDFAGKILEILVRPVKRKQFRSLNCIRIDTTTFTFDRDEANER